ncbi:MAG TPA: hypothetical protein DDW76_07755 [Cyanobacteria bacterium UBA11369]|nr:hypothetical protein [Cyanobacteria bacterium UBA11371]HBE31664.1 hypothetical protein [Cyanobacteria bacterium UBA11368]HBE48675.1 hypothetical protein [Cyanobacteria bacterium UBA11369]
MAISNNSIQQLLPLLRPYLWNENERRAYLIRALGMNTPVLNRLILNTPVDVFITSMVEELVKFGAISSGKQALCAVLEVISGDVGEDVNLRIQELLQQIKSELEPTRNFLIINERKYTETPFILEENLFGDRSNLILGNSDNNTNSYTFLEKLLEAGQWKDADRETKNILLKFSGKQEAEGLGVKELRNLPCEVLFAIDKLWITHSNKRFGLSIQQEIWQRGKLKSSPSKNKSILSKLKDILWKPDEKDNNEDDNSTKDNWYCFAEQVGWYQEGRWIPYKSLTFQLSAAEGNLPYCRGWWKKMRYQYESQRFFELMSKLERCRDLHQK